MCVFVLHTLSALQLIHPLQWALRSLHTLGEQTLSVCVHLSVRAPLVSDAVWDNLGVGCLCLVPSCHQFSVSARVWGVLLCSSSLQLSPPLPWALHNVPRLGQQAASLCALLPLELAHVSCVRDRGWCERSVLLCLLPFFKEVRTDDCRTIYKFTEWAMRPFWWSYEWHLTFVYRLFLKDDHCYVYPSNDGIFNSTFFCCSAVASLSVSRIVILAVLQLLPHHHWNMYKSLSLAFTSS